MPRELVAVAPRTPVIREYDEPFLGPRQIRIRTEFASPKHGTELVGYRDDPVASRPYSAAWGATMPVDGGGRADWGRYGYGEQTPLSRGPIAFLRRHANFCRGGTGGRMPRHRHGASPIGRKSGQTLADSPNTSPSQGPTGEGLG
jgi:hypothetical protein